MGHYLHIIVRNDDVDKFVKEYRWKVVNDEKVDMLVYVDLGVGVFCGHDNLEYVNRDDGDGLTYREHGHRDGTWHYYDGSFMCDKCSTYIQGEYGVDDIDLYISGGRLGLL